MMKRLPCNICTILLSAFVIFAVIVPSATVAAPQTTPATKTPTATIPPVLLACSHAAIPEARFTCLSVDPGTLTDNALNTVVCTDQSKTPSDQPIVSWRWEFGDGGISAEQSPRHTYTSPGRYEIMLTVTTFCGGSYTNSTTRQVNVYCSAPQPAFTTDVTEGTAPLMVQVTDLTVDTPENITQWTYWFDNSHTSYQRNPVYTYTNPGTYTINQTVRKTCMDPDVAGRPAATRRILVYPDIINATVVANQTTAASMPPSGAPLTSATPVTTAATGGVEQGVPEISRTGTLSITTEPAGVQVYVDDVLRGTSPATIPGLLKGPHTLRLEQEGYRNSTVIVVISDGKTTEYSAALVQEPGGIAILPVIILVVIVLGIAVSGIYLYRKQKRE